MLKIGAPPTSFQKTCPLKGGLAASKTPKSPTAAEKAKRSEISDFLEDLKDSKFHLIQRWHTYRCMPINILVYIGTWCT